MSLPGIEPGTLRVLDSRDNHYTTETDSDIYLYTEAYVYCIGMGGYSWLWC